MVRINLRNCGAFQARKHCSPGGNRNRNTFDDIDRVDGYVVKLPDQLFASVGALRHARHVGSERSPGWL